MRAAQDPWDKPRRNLWPIVLSCAAVILAIVLALTVSALTLNYIFDALLEDKPPMTAATSTPEPTSTPPPAAPGDGPDRRRRR